MVKYRHVTEDFVRRYTLVTDGGKKGGGELEGKRERRKGAKKDVLHSGGELNE